MFAYYKPKIIRIYRSLFLSKKRGRHEFPTFLIAKMSFGNIYVLTNVIRVPRPHKSPSTARAAKRLEAKRFIGAKLRSRRSRQLSLKPAGRVVPMAMARPWEKPTRGMPFSEDLRDELGIDRGRWSIKQADNRPESFINHRPRQGGAHPPTFNSIGGRIFRKFITAESSREKRLQCKGVTRERETWRRRSFAD